MASRVLHEKIRQHKKSATNMPREMSLVRRKIRPRFGGWLAGGKVGLGGVEVAIHPLSQMAGGAFVRGGPASAKKPPAKE